MNNVRLIREASGSLLLAVGDHYAVGARVSSIGDVGGELCALIIVPMKSLTIEEQSTVVPFKRSE